MATRTTKTTTEKAQDAGVKAPQDRLPKAEAEGTVLSVDFRGVTVTVDPDDLDDYEAVSLLAKGLPDTMLEVLVPDDTDRRTLVESCRGANGRVKLSAVVEMTSDLMGAIGAGN